jgi:tetratricopeptide (TPR) repeat protein
MYKKCIVLILICLLGFTASAQKDALAKSYFEKGDFAKALLSYQKLYETERRQGHFLKIVSCHRQLEQLDAAEALLLEKLETNKSLTYLVELGYNYQLKKDTLNASLNYNKAIEGIREKAGYAYTIGRRFEDLVLLEQAAQVYELGMELNPKSNFNIHLARIYGQLTRFEEMFAAYLSYLEYKPDYIDNIKRLFSQFITEDKNNENNVVLRKALLKKIQSNPNTMWNGLLSWLFIQQKEYKKAFAQEKAIYNRELETLEPVVDLALIAMDEEELVMARTILDFVISNSQMVGMILEAQKLQLNLDTELAEKKNFQDIKKRYLSLFEEYGKQSQTLDLQVAYAHFLAFSTNESPEAIKVLKKTLKLDLEPLEAAKVKLELGDILVFEERFNEALIFYSQIQYAVKNSVISQKARFKVAQTSYYKGDFIWAESQLKILKASTSQLTANDALDLKLLISDNRAEDSLQTALKQYAKADLLAFQNKSNEAISILDVILENHKTETIVDQALYKQAQLFEKTFQYDKAQQNYERIIADFKDDILADDAYFALAELYANHLELPEKAKELYEQIIFNYADSIYFVEARKKYRVLRGDDLN